MARPLIIWDVSLYPIDLALVNRASLCSGVSRTDSLASSSGSVFGRPGLCEVVIVAFTHRYLSIVILSAQKVLCSRLTSYFGCTIILTEFCENKTTLQNSTTQKMTHTLCVDIGNYSTLTAVVDGRTSTKPNKMRSLLYDCTHNGECRYGVHTEESPMVAFGDRHYKLGTGAKNYPGFLSAAEAGKTRADIMLPILLSATPNEFEGIVKILVPARDEMKESIITRAITGTHSYSTYRSGKKQDAIANFTGCEFYRETDAAARFAFESGAVSPDEVTLVVDIGGGTCNYLVGAYEEDHFYVRFNKSLDNSGGIALAQAIANTDLVKSYGRALEIAKIMDAITDGKQWIANRRDLTFAPVWDDCVDQWFDGIVSRIMSSCDKYLDEVSCILWVGGGVEIIRHKLTQPGHVVMDDPQYANINGLIHSSKIPALRLAA